MPILVDIFGGPWAQQGATSESHSQQHKWAISAEGPGPWALAPALGQVRAKARPSPRAQSQSPGPGLDLAPPLAPGLWAKAQGQAQGRGRVEARVENLGGNPVKNRNPYCENSRGDQGENPRANLFLQ